MKNKTLHLVLQIQIILLPFFLFGQLDVTIPSQVPETPTSDTFAKYAEPNDAVSFGEFGRNTNFSNIITRSVHGALDDGLYESGTAFEEKHEAIESALYHYNLDRYSGRFYLDNDGNIVNPDEADLVITQISEDNDENKLIWQIVTPDGTIFRYENITISDEETDNAHDQSKNIVGSPARPNPKECWLLVQKQSSDGKTKTDYYYYKH